MTRRAAFYAVLYFLPIIIRSGLWKRPLKNQFFFLKSLPRIEGAPKPVCLRAPKGVNPPLVEVLLNQDRILDFQKCPYFFVHIF